MLPDGVPAKSYCRRDDVFIGFGAAGVIKMPEGREMAWLGSHCWVCGISIEDNAKTVTPGRCRLGHDWCGKPAGHDGWCDAANAPALSYKTSNVEELSDAKRALVLDDGRGGEITIYRQPGGCLEINQPDDETGEQDIIHVCDIERWQALMAACAAVGERVPVRH